MQSGLCLFLVALTVFTLGADGDPIPEDHPNPIGQIGKMIKGFICSKVRGNETFAEICDKVSEMSNSMPGIKGQCVRDEIALFKNSLPTDTKVSIQDLCTPTDDSTADNLIRGLTQLLFNIFKCLWKSTSATSK